MDSDDDVGFDARFLRLDYLEIYVGKSVASGERYYIRETNVWRVRSESGVGHVGQLSTAQ